MTTATATLRHLSDVELEREIARLEAGLDRIDSSGYWPGADLRRAELLQALDQARAEAERRRT
jgi:hypothetical protein